MELKRGLIQECADELAMVEADARLHHEWNSPQIKKRRNFIRRAGAELIESYDFLSDEATRKRLEIVRAGGADPVGAPDRPHPRYLLH
jgi:hypothetical protein